MAERTRTRETRQRRVVYDTIKETHSHPTADWIFEKVRAEVPKISLGNRVPQPLGTQGRRCCP